ncbi:hypothetical protein Hdeb2414_s0005g00171061 [Helianthus debilis subsp. tardiflorus]
MGLRQGLFGFFKLTTNFSFFPVATLEDLQLAPLSSGALKTLNDIHAHNKQTPSLSFSCLDRQPEIGAPAPCFSPANHSPIHPHPFLTLSRRSDDRRSRFRPAPPSFSTTTTTLRHPPCFSHEDG